jgi:hypothetical protein
VAAQLAASHERLSSVSKYFGFPCQLSFHRLLRTHHLSSGAGKIGQIVSDVPSGLSHPHPQETKTKYLGQCLSVTRNSGKDTVTVGPSGKRNFFVISIELMTPIFLFATQPKEFF